MIFNKNGLKKGNGDKHLPRLYANEHKYYDNFRDFSHYIGSKFENETAFIVKHKDKETKKTSYQLITYKDFLEDIKAFACALKEKGFLNDPVAVTGKNCYQWILTYFAVLYAGGIIVPLDKEVPDVELVSSVSRSGAKTIFYDKANESAVKGANVDSFTYEQIDDFIKEGKELIKNGSLAHTEKELKKGEPAIIIFTSGTSSTSKAVLLTQENVLSNAYDAVTVENFYKEDVNMAFLPYHHTFGATSQIILLWAGVKTAYCDGLRHIKNNFVEYKVSVFVGVPALLDAIYRQIIHGVKKQGKEKQFAKGMILSKGLMKIGIDKRRKIFKEIIDELGGNLRFIISGASAADPDTLDNLYYMGITPVQGYGLTETSPILAAETPEVRRRDSVGKAFPSADLKILNPDENGIGELAAKGKGIMLGYLGDNEATNAVLSEDGWLKTGDLAYIDKEGYVFIKGRKKNVIVLKNGKNVFPEELESLIQDIPFVDEVMVYGDEKDKNNPSGGTDLVVTCKIVYNEDVMKNDYGANSEDQYMEIAKNSINIINENLPPHQQIKRIHLTNVPMIKTSTGKIKRYKEIERTN